MADVSATHQPVLGDLDAYLLGEGTHLRLYDVMGAHVRTFDGVDRDGVRGVGAERAARRASSATSTGGTATATACGCAASAAFGRCSFPASAPARATSTNSKTTRGICSRCASTRWRSTPNSARATRRSSGTHRRSRGPTARGWPRAAREQHRDAPISIYEVHLGSWARGARRGQPLSHLSRTGRRSSCRTRATWASRTSS